MKGNRLVDLLLEVLTFITPGSNMDWTYYLDAEELRNDINKHIIQIGDSDMSCLQDLQILFAPTGPLQEHSMQNGWSAEYLRLAAQFDDLYGTLSH